MSTSDQTPPIKPVLLSDLEEWRKKNIVIKKEDLEFKTSYEDEERCNRICSLKIGNNKVIGAFMRELPPGKRTSWQHRHNMEAIIHFIEGSGYSMVDGNRYDWKAGDTITIPPWTWHQHFNNTDKPSKFFAVTTIPFLTKLGLMVFERDQEKDVTT